MSLAKIAVRGTLWLTAGQYLASAVALASNLWLARMLGPSPFGTFFVISSGVDVLFSLAASFGFGQYLVQAPTITRRDCRAAMLCTAAVSAVAVAGVGVLAWTTRGRYPSETIALFMLLTLLRGAWNVSLTLASVLEHALAYRALVGCRVAAAVAAGVFALAVAARGGGVLSLLAREAGMVVVGAIATWVAVRRVAVFSDEGDRGSRLREIWRFGFRLSGVQMLELLFHRVDGVLLGLLVGFTQTAQLGYYAQAKYIANIPNAAADAGARAVAYRVFALVRDDTERLRASVEAMQFWTLRVVLPIALIFFAIPRDLCRWVLGPAWEPAAPALRALAFFGPILILFNNLKMLRLALHDWAGLYRAYLVQLAALVGGMLVGTAIGGVVGGAASVTLACSAGYLAMAARGRAIGAAPIDLRLFGLPLLAAAGVAVVAVVRPALWTNHVVLAIGSVLGLYLVLLTFIDGAKLRRSLREAAVVLWA